MVVVAAADLAAVVAPMAATVLLLCVVATARPAATLLGEATAGATAAVVADTTHTEELPINWILPCCLRQVHATSCQRTRPWCERDENEREDYDLWNQERLKGQAFDFSIGDACAIALSR